MTNVTGMVLGDLIGLLLLLSLPQDYCFPCDL